MSGIHIIAAVSRNGVIGLAGSLPWHIPEDLRRFRLLTMGYTVVMGRATWESLPCYPGPLPGRDNVVLSRRAMRSQLTPRDTIQGARVRIERDFSAVTEMARDRNVFVIGGQVLFELAMPRAKWLHLTEVQAEVMGDTYFPQWDRAEWLETSRSVMPAKGAVPAFDFTTYKRK